MNEIPTPKTRSQLAHLLMIAALALLLRGIPFVNVYLIQQADPAPRCGGDPGTYLGMAHHVYLIGDLSPSTFLPRPFLFPALAGAIYAVVGESPIVIIGINLLLNVLTCLLIYRFAHLIGLSGRGAFVAGLAAACYPAMISASVCYMTDALMMVFLVYGLVFFARFLKRPMWHDLLIAGALFALANLGRSATIVLPFLLVAIILWRLRRTWRLYGRAAIVAMWVAIAALPFVLPTLRNAVYGGIPTFSTAGQWMLLFMRATSSERRATDDPVELIYARYIQEIERRQGNAIPPLESISPVAIWDYYQPTPAEHAVISTLALETILKYPQWYILNTPYGIWRILTVAPDDSFFPRPVGGVINIGMILGAAVGGVRLWRRGKRTHLFVLGLLFVVVIGLAVALQTAVLDTRHGLAGIAAFFPLVGAAFFPPPADSSPPN
ncbi:MAG: glycosyltransferase family 39 protein [Anaerolineales bacterium]|nr:glycosyltransferase family 39 protein [Anaerolineales bacterium]